MPSFYYLSIFLSSLCIREFWFLYNIDSYLINNAANFHLRSNIKSYVYLIFYVYIVICNI